MRRLLSLVQSGRFDATPFIIHRFSLDEIPQAYQLFGERSDGVLKVAINLETAIESAGQAASSLIFLGHAFANRPRGSSPGR